MDVEFHNRVKLSLSSGLLYQYLLNERWLESVVCQGVCSHCVRSSCHGVRHYVKDGFNSLRYDLLTFQYVWWALRIWSNHNREPGGWQHELLGILFYVSLALNFRQFGQNNLFSFEVNICTNDIIVFHLRPQVPCRVQFRDVQMAGSFLFPKLSTNTRISKVYFTAKLHKTLESYPKHISLFSVALLKTVAVMSLLELSQKEVNKSSTGKQNQNANQTPPPNQQKQPTKQDTTQGS